MRYLLGAGLALAIPATLHAEALTFDAALERAARQAPSLRASEAGIAATSAALRQTGCLIRR